jgi:hypothetical protein
MKLQKKLFCLLNPLTLLISLSSIPAAAKSPGDYGTPSTSPTLSETLVQARKSVGTFWKQFTSVTCIEKIAQEKLGKKGNREYLRRSTFDYLVLSNAQGDAISVEESRLEQGKSGKVKNIPLMIANGLPMLLLVFHPYYEEDFEYRLQGEELVDGSRLVKIGFRHIPGMRSTTALRLRGKDYPLDLQGTAFIDPQTGTIHRIVAGIAGPMSDFNLKSLEMDVQYAPFEFPPATRFYWLPSTATVDVHTELQHWRNIHQYSNYKRFTVATEEKVSK